MSTQFVMTSDGVQIAYDIVGHGPDLMLLHGAGKSRLDWQTVDNTLMIACQIQHL